MTVKDVIYVCQRCKSQWCTADVEILPEWEADFDEKELKELSKKEYCVEDAWCRKCAEQKGYILFDSRHPVVKYISQRKQYKSVVGEVFKEVTQRFLENVTDEVLWQLNTEAFNWFANETKSGKKKAAKAYCRDAEKQIREYIEDEIYNNQRVLEEKAKLEPLNCEIIEFLGKYPYGIKELVSLKVDKAEMVAIYSNDPDDFFVWRVNKHIGGKIRDLIEEDKISGKRWADFLIDLGKILSA